MAQDGKASRLKKAHKSNHLLFFQFPGPTAKVDGCHSIYLHHEQEPKINGSITNCVGLPTFHRRWHLVPIASNQPHQSTVGRTSCSQQDLALPLLAHLPVAPACGVDARLAVAVSLGVHTGRPVAVTLDLVAMRGVAVPRHIDASCTGSKAVAADIDALGQVFTAPSLQAFQRKRASSQWPRDVGQEHDR